MTEQGRINRLQVARTTGQAEQLMVTAVGSVALPPPARRSLLLQLLSVAGASLLLLPARRAAAAGPGSSALPGPGSGAGSSTATDTAHSFASGAPRAAGDGASAGPGNTLQPAGTADAPVLMVVGDSLSAEYGLQRGEGWVALLGQRLASDRSDLRRPDWRLVNASISGETTAGGRSRLPALLAQHRPALTVIELGGNDALRGLPLAAVSANLQQMIRDAHAHGSRVLLLGMQVPPNYGPVYARQFSQMYQQLAEKNRVALVPFLLEGFGTDRQWFQPDGIHPTAAAQSKMLDNVWPILEGLL